MSSITFPIQVKAILLGREDVLRPSLLMSQEAGDFVAVRPCAEEHKGTTFLGLMLGEVSMSKNVKYDPKTEALTFTNSGYNPAMLVPDLKAVIYGCESWWSLIKTPEDLKKITDQDINNVWYVKALKHLQEQKQG
jgi:hypothetical protein